LTRKLGTFYGVFTPTVLTILGVIMYLRFGWLVGHLGLGRVLPIVLLANAITLITTLSFSAVATNKQVGSGGAYYIISRSLGIEIGGAIGVPLFLSQALSVTLYAYGLAESLRFVWPDLPLQAVTAGVIVAVGLLAYLGAEKALRAQLPLLILVGASLAALAAGAMMRSGGAVPLHQPTGEVGFWRGFAVFFPAVTGVMAGLGLSGDLKDPMRSLPRGAFAAVLTGLAVYMVVPVLLAVGADPQALRDDPLVWARVAVGGHFLVLPGLWAAIFSSALGSILGAPRTLQALARDGLAPRLLNRRRVDRNHGDQPDLLPALVVSLALALGAVLLGDLNTVAEVVSMFFLTVYCVVNLVAAFEALSGDPSWRPRLHSPWWINLAGGIACLGAMVLINPAAGFLALLLELGLYLGLSRKEFQAGWGDARRGLYENLIRWALVKLDQQPMTARSWRPHILVFVEELSKELDLVRFADWFCQHRGVVTVCKLLVGPETPSEETLHQGKEEMRDLLATERVVAFPEVDLARDLVDGIVDVTQANGMGGIASNTVLLGWPEDPQLQIDFLRAMRRLEVLNKSLIFARVRPKLLYKRAGVERQIMVWWGGLQRNGDLMLLLTYLLSGNSSWRNARVKVMSLATTETMKQQNELNLKRLLSAIRIEADIEVLLKDPEAKVADVIRERSADAEVVLIGLATPDKGQEAEYAARLEVLTEGLPNVLFVKNASCFVGELITDEEEEDPAAGPSA
jgi:potassium/chloride transporter 4/5/6